MNKVSENPSKNRIGDFNSLTVLSGLLITLYLTANIMAVKIIEIGNVSIFDAGTITFPFTYMIGDVLSEIWGYKTTKKIIFLTFLSNAMLIIFTTIAVYLPAPADMAAVNESFAIIFGYVPRIVIASLISFLIGELANSKVLVKLRDASPDGSKLWLRTISSSVVGHLLDTVLFVIIAFAGTVPASSVWSMIWIQYLSKLLIEVAFGTPLAYILVSNIKRRCILCR